MAEWRRRPSRVVVVSLLAVALLVTGCSVAVDETDAGPLDSAIEPATSVPTAPAEPDPDSPWPAQRPADLRVSFGQDGGMSPWSEDIDIDGDRSAYVVWMDSIEYRIVHTPAPERLDALYDEIAIGRFDLYEAIPFEDDDMIYDAEQESWLVRFGDFRHRVSVAGNEIARPDAAGAPLSAMSRFNDIESVPAAAAPTGVSVVIAIDEDAPGLFEVDLAIDIGAADLAVGDDRWTTSFELWLSEPVAAAPILLTRSGGADNEVLFDETVDLSADIRLTLTTAGGVPTIENEPLAG